MNTILEQILGNIARNQNPEQAVIHKKYHKSELRFHGLPVPVMREIAAHALKEIVALDGLLNIFYQLWERPDFETRSIALFMLMKRVKWLKEEQFPLFHPLFRDCDGWALTDYLGIKILGEFLRKYPLYHDRVDAWKEDHHLWVRRAGILRFITQAKHKDPWPERMEPIMIFHLAENDFFIRKVLGWNLREWAAPEPERVRGFVTAFRETMSPLTFREAIRNMPGQPDS